MRALFAVAEHLVSVVRSRAVVAMSMNELTYGNFGSVDRCFSYSV